MGVGKFSFLLISFGRFLSYFGSHFVSGRRSVAGYTTDATYKMEAKEPERWQKVNIPSMSTQTVGINRTHLKYVDECKYDRARHGLRAPLVTVYPLNDPRLGGSGVSSRE